MKCSSCQHPKAALKEKRSVLLKGIKVWLCDTCISKGREPRHNVILAGRLYGPDFVKDFVTKKRYVGAEITAAELIA